MIVNPSTAAWVLAQRTMGRWTKLILGITIRMLTSPAAICAEHGRASIGMRGRWNCLAQLRSRVRGASKRDD